MLLSSIYRCNEINFPPFAPLMGRQMECVLSCFCLSDSALPSTGVPAQSPRQIGHLVPRVAYNALLLLPDSSSITHGRKLSRHTFQAWTVLLCSQLAGFRLTCQLNHPHVGLEAISRVRLVEQVPPLFERLADPKSWQQLSTCLETLGQEIEL